MDLTKKKYGLIIPDKAARKKPVVNQASVFADDEDDDNESQGAVNQKLKAEGKKALAKRQLQMQVEKALVEDPNVYEYDKVYDEMQEKKASTDKRLSSNVDHKPKYIGNLIKAAEERKKELERRIEKKVQKEREAEKGLYADKEAFVTDAYRRKMLEMQQQEEEERRRREIEEHNDVTKLSDLSGFYRGLLRQTTEEVTPPGETETKHQPGTTVEAVTGAQRSPADFPDDRDDSQSDDDDSSDDAKSTEDARRRHGTKDVPLDRHKSDKRDRGRRNSSDDEKQSDSKNRSDDVPVDRHKSDKREKSRRHSSDDEKHSGSKNRSDKSEKRRHDSSEHEKRDRGENQSGRDSRRDKHGDKEQSVKNKHEKDKRDEYRKDNRQSSDRKGESSRSKHEHRHKERGDEKRDISGKPGRKDSRERERDRIGNDEEKRVVDIKGGKSKVDKDSDTSSSEEDGSSRTVAVASQTVKANGAATEVVAATTEKFVKRNIGDTIDSARARYLARKRAMCVETVKEDD